MTDKNMLTTPFEKDQNYSASYAETINYFKYLSDHTPKIQMSTFGKTDIGKPLHEIVISLDGTFDPVAVRKADKTVLLINNAIHPGEPCGIDASMMLARDIATKSKFKPLLQKLVIVIIPVYNIGGALNRSATSRANQDGPALYGFRGNAQNLDLNRDFIKCDSKNAASFNQLFNKWDPDVFIDNHTSNGADYQYVMTLIATQKDKLSKSLGKHLEKEMLPALYAKMKKKKYEMTPYVYAENTPDEGIIGFLDLPRYSSGYGALNNTISFMPETHMLKTYEHRVKSTYAFMMSMVEHLQTEGQALRKARNKAIKDNKKQKSLPLSWKLDRSKSETFSFKGFEAGYKKSEVSGHSRLYYDRKNKYKKDIPFYNNYNVSLEVKVPKSYIIPQAYTKVIERLEWNKVEMDVLKKDTVVSGEFYYIDEYSTRPGPYEGHYLHSKVTVKAKKMKRQFYAGDVKINTDQKQIRYIVETLEPQAPDSFFAWNFFDGILNQKEYFSPYVFEDLAAEILKKNKKLNSDFQKRKKEDAAFAEDAYAQLQYIYKNSEYYEDTFKLYPIARTF